MQDEIKARLRHWPSTAVGVALLVLAFFAWLRPSLLDDPQKFGLLCAAVAALLTRGSENKC